jgi:bifunctional DNA-binding transcriptional regulator/antitoxin component of YhaV-PrlF toxin-antitoxin module
MTWITASLGPKGQITLPKRVRELLGAKEPGELIGFLLDEETGAVRLSRMEVRPTGDDYTEDELRKLAQLAKERGGRKFRSAEAFLQHIKKL